MKSKKDVSTLIFDLGNVVFQVKWEGFFGGISRLSGSDVEPLRSRFRFDDALAQFERGEISGEEYGRHICEMLGVELSYEQFRDCWCDIYGEELKPVTESIARVKDRLEVVAYTNTNEVHNEIWPSLYADAISNFKKVYSSSELGVRKPESAGFEFILSELGRVPEEAVFFDDLEQNVEAARAIGMRAYLVDVPEVVPSALDELGLL